MSHHNVSNAPRRARRLALAGLVPMLVLGIGLGSGGTSSASSARPQAASNALAGNDFVAGQLLVRFAPGTSTAAASAVNAKLGATTAKSFASLVPNLQLVQLKPGLSV